MLSDGRLAALRAEDSNDLEDQTQQIMNSQQDHAIGAKTRKSSINKSQNNQVLTFILFNL